MVKLRNFVLLLVGAFVGFIIYKNPFPIEISNLIVAFVIGSKTYIELKEELKGEEGKSKTAGDPKIGTMCLFSDDEEEFNKNLGQVDILSDIDDQRMRKYISKSCDSWKYCKQIKIKEV